VVAVIKDDKVVLVTQYTNNKRCPKTTSIKSKGLDARGRCT
jgi:hypothetical protein